VALLAHSLLTAHRTFQ